MILEGAPVVKPCSVPLAFVVLAFSPQISSNAVSGELRRFGDKGCWSGIGSVDPIPSS
jgi:hypothetical protein